MYRAWVLSERFASAASKGRKCLPDSSLNYLRKHFLVAVMPIRGSWREVKPIWQCRGRGPLVRTRDLPESGGNIPAAHPAEETFRRGNESQLWALN